MLLERLRVSLLILILFTLTLSIAGKYPTSFAFLWFTDDPIISWDTVGHK